MSDSPVAILYDENGNPVSVVLDGSVYKLEALAKLQAGTAIVGKVGIDAAEKGGLAEQATLATRASEATLASLDGKDFATQTTLATRASEATLAAQAVDVASIAAEDFATETTLATRASETTAAAINGKLGTIDSVLDSIKDTDGVRKITDPLPVGTNILGKVGIDPAEKGGLAEQATLLSIKDTDGVRKITDPLPVGTNEIGAVKQGTKAAAADAWPQRLVDSLGNELDVIDVGGKKLLRVAAEADAITTNPVNRLLTSDGTPTGSTDLVVDGSTPVPFWVPADAVDTIVINRIKLVMVATNLVWGDFGGSGGLLTNGVLLEIKAGGITTSFVLKRNADFVRIALPPYSEFNGTTDIIAADIVLPGRTVLVGGSADEIRIIIRDNLTSGPRGLSYFTANLFGFIEV